MKFDAYFADVASRAGVRKWFIVMLTMSLICNVLLASRVAFVSDKTRQIITPPNINQSFWVDDSGVSKEYLNQMAIFLAQLNFNVTPATVDYQHTELLKFMAPEAYGVLDKEFRLTSATLKNDNVATWFTPQFVASDENTLTTVIQGEFYTTQGEKVVSRSQRSIELKFKYSGSKMTVTAMKDISDRKPTSDGQNATKVEEKANPAANSVPTN